MMPIRTRQQTHVVSFPTGQAILFQMLLPSYTVLFWTIFLNLEPMDLSTPSGLLDGLSPSLPFFFLVLSIVEIFPFQGGLP